MFRYIQIEVVIERGAGKCFAQIAYGDVGSRRSGLKVVFVALQRLEVGIHALGPRRWCSLASGIQAGIPDANGACRTRAKFLCH